VRICFEKEDSEEDQPKEEEEHKEGQNNDAEKDPSSPRGPGPIALIGSPTIGRVAPGHCSNLEAVGVSLKKKSYQAETQRGAWDFNALRF
jgi:hypothetical protein